MHLLERTLCTVLATAAPVSAQEQAPREVARAIELPAVAVDTLDAWRAHIRPASDEAEYESIPWIPTFYEGVRASAAAGKPLLFWAMNGHPLGCT